MNDGRLVAVAFHEPELGGASRSVLNVMPLLARRGWRFTCWVPGPGELRDELRRRGHPVAGSPRLLRYSRAALSVPPGTARRLASVPGYLRDFRRWVRRASPALLHANTLLAIPEAVAARGTGPGHVLYVHETLPADAKGRAGARLARLAADRVIGISAATVAALEAGGISARLVHNGVAVPEQAPVRAGGGRLVVGTLGRISWRKGSDVFVAAAERVRRAEPDVALRMVGPIGVGREAEWVAEVMASARRHEVTWGVVGDVWAELAEWDMLVLASRDEPFGLAIVEAMAAALPVVSTRVGGVPEIVTPETGILVAPDDPEALATAIVTLVRDPERRRTMGAAGRARVEEAFTLEQQAEGVHRVYLEALADRSSSARPTGPRRGSGRPGRRPRIGYSRPPAGP